MWAVGAWVCLGLQCMVGFFVCNCELVNADFVGAAVVEFHLGVGRHIQHKLWRNEHIHVLVAAGWRKLGYYVLAKGASAI